MSESTLYNKYRPSDFSGIVGQDHIIKLISHQLKNNELPHSLIFHGGFGTGKTSVARIIASTLNPSDTGTLEQDCTVEANVDFTRRLQNEVKNYAFEGLIKTYIFDEAHNIPNKAFDGLLKTVEETPDHVYFIFVTSDFSKIPDSIKSRSADYKFLPIPNKDLILKLNEIAVTENIKLSDYLLHSVIDKSRGSLRNAIVDLQKIKTAQSFAQSEEDILKIIGFLDFSIIDNFIKSCFLKDFYKLVEAVDLFCSDGVDPLDTILQLQKFIIELRFNLSSKNYNGQTKDLAEFLTSNNLLDPSNPANLKSGARYLDFLYDELVKVYSDLKFLPFPEQRLRRLSIEIIKSWTTK
jgi:DNA polymerase-3 subunit gamma/tau